MVNREHDVGLTADAVRPYLQDGYPWHRWQTPHAQLMPGTPWWEYVIGILARALADVGIEPDHADSALARFPDEYMRADAFVVYDDVIPALTTLQRSGYRCCIASNHTPELPRLVGELELSSYFTDVFTSATIGADKPNRIFYEFVLDAIGAAPSDAVMVGDGFGSDVTGAINMGLTAIWVRPPNDRGYDLHAANLIDAVALIERIARPD